MRRRLIFAAVLWLWSLPAFAAITTGTGATGNTTPASVDTIDITMTVDATSDNVIYCMVGANETTDSNPTVVWDPTGANESLTQLAESNTPGRYISIFRKVGATAGASKTVRFASMSTAAKEVVICKPFYGVDQGTPEDTLDIQRTASSVTTISTGTITSPAGDWIVSFVVSASGGTYSVTGGGNVLAETAIIDTSGFKGAIAYDADGADDTIDWSWSPGAPAATYGFNVNASGGGGGGGVTPKGSLLGVLP